MPRASEFELRPSGTQGLADLFDRSELDLALIGNSLPAERFESAVLLEDRYVAVMRRGHPALGQPLTLEALGSLPHLGISSSRENLGFLDNALSAVGQSRHVTLQAPYLSAGALLTGSDRIVVLGEQLAREFSRTHAVDFAPLAIPSPAIRSVMVWHRRVSEQPAHRWLRETISQTAQRLQTGRGCVPARA